MRRRNALPDPDVVHALRELDAALAGEPGADPELTDLVVAVRAARPEADPAFLASLDARVHAGFPRDDAATRSRRRRVRLLLPPALAATAAAALVAVLVALPGSSNDRGAGSAASVSSRAPGGKTAAGAGTAAGSGATESVAAAPKPSAAPAVTPQSRGTATPFPGALKDATSRVRKVERAAQLTLTPAAADVQSTADGVVRETQALGGYVQRSQVSTSDLAGTATFTLRLPSARLDEAIARLSKLAHVGSLTQDATDITSSYDSAAGRLDDARAERRALLRALGRATTDRQIASLRARLRDNRARIAAAAAVLDQVRRRAQLATVSVEIQGTGKPEHQGGGAWTPRDALHDAGRVLEVAGGVALIALAVLLPLGLLALLSLPLARALRRRRREAVLDRP